MYILIRQGKDTKMRAIAKTATAPFQNWEGEAIVKFLFRKYGEGYFRCYIPFSFMGRNRVKIAGMTLWQIKDRRFYLGGGVK